MVEEGTYARAAERVGFTQSAVSQQIASLEKAAGVKVFDRPKGPKPVELTSAGRIVLEYARQALASASEVESELDRVRRGVSGVLTVGTFQSASTRLLPSIIGRLRALVPDVEVRVVEMDDQDRLVAGVTSSEMDLVFAIDQRPDSRLVVDVLGDDPFVVVAPVGEATGTSVRAEDLADRALVGQPHGDTCQLMIDDRLRAAGLRPEYAYRLADNAAVQSMVRSSLAWAVMPALAVEVADPGIVVLDLDPAVPPRTLQLIRRAHHTLIPAADVFIRLAHEVADGVLLGDGVSPTPVVGR